MRKYLLLLVLICGGFSLNAQVNQNFYNDRALMLIQDEPIKGLTGNPFLNEEFQKGLIIADNVEAQPAFLRYDAMDGKMEIKLEEHSDEVYELPRVKDIKYILDGHTYYIDSKRTSRGELLEGYFIQYFKGENIQLLGWPKLDVERASKAETGYEKDKSAHIEVEMEYYIKMDDKRLEEVRLRPRNFRKFFNDSNDMKEYLSRNKVRDVEDAIKALEFYESNAEGKA